MSSTSRKYRAILQPERLFVERIDAIIKDIYDGNRLPEILKVAIGNAEHVNEIQTMAFTDKLTENFNRRFLEERLSAELRNARQQKYPLSLAILDVDHFKNVNDTFGHATGDKVLQRLGYLLKTRVRKGDTVARFGGEEFAIILPPLETVHRILEKIR